MLNTDTAYLGLLGNPLSHSHSPLMHNAVFEKLGVNALYFPLEIAVGMLGQAILGLQALGFRGVNVTIPFKEAVIPFLDDLSPEAHLFQAVNVVAFAGGKKVGHNTDGLFYFGFREGGARIGSLSFAGCPEERQFYQLGFGAKGSSPDDHFGY